MIEYDARGHLPHWLDAPHFMSVGTIFDATTETLFVAVRFTWSGNLGG